MMNDVDVRCLVICNPTIKATRLGCGFATPKFSRVDRFAVVWFAT